MGRILTIKAEKEGYDPCFINFNVKYVARITYFDAPWHYMKKHITYYKSLDEVVVKASKVQLVWKGDTMVFNADAFNIPDGSMLDDLIRQLQMLRAELSYYEDFEVRLERD